MSESLCAQQGGEVKTIGSINELLTAFATIFPDCDVYLLSCPPQQNQLSTWPLSKTGGGGGGGNLRLKF